MTRLKPFDALAYAIDVLGQQDETSKNRFAEESQGIASSDHLWRSGRRWVLVAEWSDGDQTTSAGVAGMTSPGGVRNNGDGSLCLEYEAQARRLIDAFYETRRLIDGVMK